MSPRMEASGQRFRAARTLFRKRKGLLRMSEAVRFGITRKTLYAMRDAGVLEPLSRGLYRLKEMEPLGDPDLVHARLANRARAMKRPFNEMVLTTSVLA